MKKLKRFENWKQQRNDESFMTTLRSSYLRQIFNCCEISTSDIENPKSILLGDYILSLKPNIEKIWVILNGGNIVSDFTRIKELARIHMGILQERPLLPPVRFSGSKTQVYSWLEEYMEESGALAAVIALDNGIPINDLIA